MFKKVFIALMCLTVVGVGAYVSTAAVPDGIARFTSLIVGSPSDTPDVTPGDDDLYVKGTAEVDGAVRLDGGLTMAGDFTAAQTAGNNVTMGNSTGNFTITSDNADFTLTDTTDNVFQLVNSGGAVLFDVDLGAADAITIGSGVAQALTLQGKTVAITGDDDISLTLTAATAGEDLILDQNGNVDASILISTEGSGTDALSLSTLTNGGDIVVSSVDNVSITSTTASGIIDVGGTAGLVITIGNDDTTADDIDIGSDKDDLDLEGEDITLDSADDMDCTVADDITVTMESAGGIFAIGGTAGSVCNIYTDDTTADTIAIGSAKDDITVAGEDITLTTADDVDITSTSASGIIALGGTPGLVFNIATDDTTADDVNIGSAKDDVDVAGEDFTVTSADDIALLSSSAGGILNLMTGTAGYVVNVGTDNSAADDINVGSALDDVTIAAEDITLTTADDCDITSSSAGGIIALGGTAGQVFNIGTDDTTADTIAIGSAKDALTINSVQFDVASDVTLAADTTGGNALAKSEFIGLPRIMNVGIGTMANGTTNTIITDIGDSETPATDWTAIDADTTMSNDSTYYRQGTASLKMVLGASAASTDGCTNTLASGDQDWTDDESVGMWVYATQAFDADDLNLVITDSVAGDTTVQFPAYTSANTWQWLEVNIGGVANASKDVITDLSIEINAASDLIGTEASLYFDFIVKWDSNEEESLGQAIVSDGVMSLTVIDATDAGASCANLTLYTDYFIHYQSGNDAIVIMSDQSGADKVGLALIAY